jgi:predicted membrane channel-forming protein YqfA (hemolysin III family)
MVEPTRVWCSLPKEREQMLRLLFWVVVGAAVLLVVPPLIPLRYRNIAVDNAVRLVGIVIILFALGETSYVHVPDGHLG